MQFLKIHFGLLFSGKIQGNIRDVKQEIYFAVQPGISPNLSTVIQSLYMYQITTNPPDSSVFKLKIGALDQKTCKDPHPLRVK